MCPLSSYNVDNKWTVRAISIKYKILCIFPLGCVQIVPAGCPGLVALLYTSDVTGHIVYKLLFVDDVVAVELILF